MVANKEKVSERHPLRSDRGLAAAIGILAFVVYLRTLLPDVGGPEDAPKFQYLGAALGTAHPPGYPLHTLLSHLFSYLPIGTIAYRANLLSAVAGATAVSLAVLLARALGRSRPAAAFAALTIAFGAAFWGYAVIAEVYTLSAALLLAIMFWLVRWKQTRRDAHLYGAAACFALALGNHLAIVAAAPAIAMFLLATDARRALRPRTLMTAGAIVSSGFLQYLYVLIRTRQGTPYREASATNLTELAAVIRGRGYEDYVFAFSWDELIGQRLPEFARLAQAELGLAGVALAVAGLVLLAVRDWRTATLLALAFAGVTGFELNIFGDLRGFLVIPLVLAAPFIAVGADGVRDIATSAWRTRGAAAATVLLMLYPAWQLRANFAANDWRPRTQEARFFRAMFEQLPSSVAVVPEDYVADSIVTYLQVESGGARTLLHVDPHAAAVRTAFDAGQPVYALNKRYEELAARGFHFVPVRLWMDDVEYGRLAASPGLPAGPKARDDPFRRRGVEGRDGCGTQRETDRARRQLPPERHSRQVLRRCRRPASAAADRRASIRHWAGDVTSSALRPARIRCRAGHWTRSLPRTVPRLQCWGALAATSCEPSTE